MKKYITYKGIAVILVSILTFVSCETDFENPNAASADEVFNTREGLFSATIGMSQIYSTSGLRFIIETPAITTREAGITTTFQNMIELEDGGAPLPNFNSNVIGIWRNLMRVMGVAEDIAANTPNVQLDEGTTSGLIAYANLFRAMSIGSLSQNYEQVIILTNPDNNATFVSRQEGFNEAIRLLTEARDLITTTPVSDEFDSEILRGNIDLLNTINAILARYQLFAGNYDAAITSAGNVNQSSTSVFSYDVLNPNPIWTRVFQNNISNFKPRDNFGLPASFVFDANDGRLDFYLDPLDEDNQNGLPIENLKGFFQTDTESIPLYLPDEMNLIIAEAHLRKASPDISAAIAAINAVRTDTDDAFGINADIDPYSGEQTVNALLDEVYQNRRAELFLTGMSLEDSRRFGRPEPSTAIQVFTDERNRNFYPYPETERNNNTNTPADPSI
ncbi:RagB/SusD family nutrient uptake outer membrane protein [Ascidiimonas aurantiaca]|uniref:RagB/SusD family nutrient uptake outer membrane protein n=1 Tax=Ascidiimonas aurantiaca TaxID=1685432 RepID=UPI0030EB1948